MKTLRLLILVFILLVAPLSIIQAQESKLPGSLSELKSALDRVRDDSSTLDSLWEALVDAGQIPFIDGNNVVFLYRGAAHSVAWRGDFTRWGNTPDMKGLRIGASELWEAVSSFPRDARLEYYIVLDGREAILDPANPRQAWGGIEIKSEFMMPDYQPSPYLATRSDITHGIMGPFQMIISAKLGYTVMYRVYTPAGYEKLSNLPVIYVTDGQDYSHPQLGNMPNVLDNVIASGLIQPVITVFIDPRDPHDLGKNRRESELLENPDYAAFIAHELVPTIDQHYKTNPARTARAILGCSFGGVNAMYVTVAYPEVFGLTAAQSPILGRLNLTNELLQKNGPPDIKFFVTSGKEIYGDVEVNEMEAVLQQMGMDYKMMVVNEGHSFSQWNAQLDDMLLYFFGKS